MNKSLIFNPYFSLKYHFSVILCNIFPHLVFLCFGVYKTGQKHIFLVMLFVLLVISAHKNIRHNLADYQNVSLNQSSLIFFLISLPIFIWIFLITGSGKILGVLFPIVFIKCFLWIRFLLYKRTIFSILDNRIQYKQDFIMLSQKSICYKDIKEVKLHDCVARSGIMLNVHVQQKPSPSATC